ncbi:MAG: hypothetical protein U0793_19140 [Gemmataceae bacterium]
MPRLLCLGLLLFAPALHAGDRPDAAASAKARRDFERAKPDADLLKLDAARVPLTKEDAAAVRDELWKRHVARIKATRSEEFAKRLLQEGKLEMPFFVTEYGEKPKKGRSLWLSLHGGGGAPKAVNDKQWENQKRLYKLSEGYYVAPRAPTNTWNLWHEGHIDRFFGRLIEDFVVLGDVDPDRVYVMGYSAGGDGIYQIGPRLADRWAGAAMMAGHPNGASLLNLRNVAFALQVGGNDSAYNRNKVGREYGAELERLHKADPGGYPNFVKIHEGKGHWMDLQDAAALPWMAKFSRNPAPERVVWRQEGGHDRSYWLAVPPEEKTGGALVIVSRKGQTIEIEKAEKVKRLILRLDDSFIDLDQPVRVIQEGKAIFEGRATRTPAALLKSLDGRGDPRLIFAAELVVTVGK